MPISTLKLLLLVLLRKSFALYHSFDYYNFYDYEEQNNNFTDDEIVNEVDLSAGLDRNSELRAELFDIPSPDAVTSGEITLEELLAETGFDLRYTQDERFQKLRQFRRLFTFYLVGYRLRPAHLVQYGCWCFPRGQLIMGFGQPVDDIDATCRNHQLCLHCVGMDTEYECDPNMQPYRVYGQIYQNGRRLVCRDPPGSCSWLACQCDVNMVTTVILASLRAYKPRFWRYNPQRCLSFDRQHDTPPDQCCGKYPERYPFHSVDKQCCKGKLFNPLHSECCVDSEVRTLGEC